MAALLPTLFGQMNYWRRFAVLPSRRTRLWRSECPRAETSATYRQPLMRCGSCSAGAKRRAARRRLYWLLSGSRAASRTDPAEIVNLSYECIHFLRQWTEIKSYLKRRKVLSSDRVAVSSGRSLVVCSFQLTQNAFLPIQGGRQRRQEQHIRVSGLDCSGDSRGGSNNVIRAIVWVRRCQSGGCCGGDGDFGLHRVSPIHRNGLL